MKRPIKKYLSIFCLFVFLLPSVAGQIHKYQHNDDEQCSEQQTTHFHKTEHHCFLCDYIPATSSEPVYIDLSVRIFTFSQNISSQYTAQVINFPIYNYSLRAPPEIS